MVRNGWWFERFKKPEGYVKVNASGTPGVSQLGSRGVAATFEDG